jgi:alkylation response protein AidB-like acyl-CoA dehydrogenase
MASAARVLPEDPTQAGGDFIFKPVASREFLTRERLTQEQRDLFATAREFMINEVEPRAEEIDHKKPGVLPSLMKQAAELGLFRVGIPEAYDGLDLDKTTTMLIAEAVASVGSFAVTYGAHTGIGTLPLVYYGTDAQKQKYLPKLASGELLGAYCLSEAGSGSDALAAKTTAKLTPDGKHYVLNGTKAWITNGGFADLYTVFAQVVDNDDHKFTAFLVERKTPGVSVGKEERKLGIRGSSTTTVILDDVKVPVENVLGEIGRGHKIAFNILNIGRWKLGVGSVGGSKNALGYGVRYAKERHQFKQPIASFGLVRKKLADAATSIYAGESMAFRLAGLVDTALAALDKKDPDYFKKAIDVIEEYTIEASVLKVYGSETHGQIVDEMLQIHGGNGFTEDYPIERLFRDARINRIFEGTNEINRLIIPATLLKRALKGRVPLLQYTQEVVEELASPDKLPQKGEGPLANEIWATELVKRAVVYAASYAAQKYLDELKNRQRILGALADCIICVYGMDSVVGRARQAATSVPKKDAELQAALASLYCFDARAAIFQNLRRVAMIMCEGEELDLLYENLGKLDQRYRVDVYKLQEAVVEHCLERNGYGID